MPFWQCLDVEDHTNLIAGLKGVRTGEAWSALTWKSLEGERKRAHELCKPCSFRVTVTLCLLLGSSRSPWRRWAESWPSPFLQDLSHVIWAGKISWNTVVCSRWCYWARWGMTQVNVACEAADARNRSCNEPWELGATFAHGKWTI